MNGGVVLLDKDGTLIENVPMNVDPAQIRLTRGAGEALRRLAEAKFRLGIVTNQAGVAFGQFPETALVQVHERISTLLGDYGVPLEGFFHCPHHPDATVAAYRFACDCRKPKPGLIHRAVHALGGDRARTWMVGDILDDVEAGRRAGCRTILFDSGGETEWRDSPLRRPDFIASSFTDVVDRILADEACAS
jgi:D-glycero-D-manno-heptose 1,7-bisphosphate phosphatase